MSYLDGLDWSPLGFGSNPVPGDPSGVHALAAQLEGLADDADVQNQHLRSVGGSTSEFWQGPAASEVQKHLGKLPGELDKLVTSYRDAANALHGYAPKLLDSQDRVYGAWQMARQAQDQIGQAQHAVAAAQGQVNSTGAAYNQAVAAQTPPPLPPGAAPPPPPSPAQVAQAQAATNQAQAAYQQAQAQAQAANQALSQAQGQLDHAKQMASDAIRDGSRAADGLASALHEASKAGIPNKHHHWYDAPVDAVEGAISGGAHWVAHEAKDAWGGAEKDLQKAEQLAKKDWHKVEHAAVADWRQLENTAKKDWRKVETAAKQDWRQAEHDAKAVGHAANSVVKDVVKHLGPEMEIFSKVLGWVTVALAVVALPLDDCGLGEVISVANDGLLAMKTADDAALAADGNAKEKKYGRGQMGGDVLAVATFGTSKAIGAIGKALKATKSAEGVGEDASKVKEAQKSLDDAKGNLKQANDKLDKARDGGADKGGLRGDSVKDLEKQAKQAQTKFERATKDLRDKSYNSDLSQKMTGYKQDGSGNWTRDAAPSLGSRAQTTAGVLKHDIGQEARGAGEFVKSPAQYVRTNIKSPDFVAGSKRFAGQFAGPQATNATRVGGTMKAGMTIKAHYDWTQKRFDQAHVAHLPSTNAPAQGAINHALGADNSAGK